MLVAQGGALVPADIAGVQLKCVSWSLGVGSAMSRGTYPVITGWGGWIVTLLAALGVVLIPQGTSHNIPPPRW